MNKQSALLILFLFCITIVIYFPWFTLHQTLSSGDWPYLYKENIEAFSIFRPPFLWVDPYYQLTAKIGVSYLGLTWEVTEKIFWFIPFIIISSLSAWIFCLGFFKKLFNHQQASIASLIGVIIYTTNTYILMIVGGGQMGVALSYALAPLVLHSFFSLLGSNRRRKSPFILSAIVSSVQLMFDPRVFLITISIIFLYCLINVFLERKFFSRFFDVLTVLSFSFLLNSFWILPNLFNYNVQYDEAASALEVIFLSFANFSNTISLLHPNWPENIFGKIYFMRPEFLLLPILAFASLLFVEKNNKKDAKIIIFYTCAAIIGAFLAKGTNPPFGETYLLLSALPGFMIFRDSTKFFIFVIIAFSVLIPFSVFRLSLFLEQKKLKVMKHATGLFVLCFLLYWFFLLLPVLTMSLGGTFKPRTVPREYISLKIFIADQKEYFSTLWIPQHQRFGFASHAHPAMNSIDILGQVKTTELRNILQKKETRLQLQKEDIRYIVVPYDSEKEIFLKDHTYSQKEKAEVVSVLNSISWLKRIPVGHNIKEIIVYELQ